MRITRVVPAAAAGLLAAVGSAAAHPGHGLDAGLLHDLGHVAEAVIVIAVVALLAAMPGVIARRS